MSFLRRWIDNNRRVLAVSAWMTVIFILIGYLISVPTVDAWLMQAEKQSALVRVMVALLLLLAALTAVVLWASALRHAIADTHLQGTRRVLVIAVLIATNFVGGFFYYFLRVVWRTSTEGDPKTPMHLA